MPQDVNKKNETSLNFSHLLPPHQMAMYGRERPKPKQLSKTEHPFEKSDDYQDLFIPYEGPGEPKPLSPETVSMDYEAARDDLLQLEQVERQNLIKEESTSALIMFGVFSTSRECSESQGSSYAPHVALSNI